MPDFTMPQPMAQSCWAAVSFVFEDAPWCDWIYREFDGSRVPRPLAGRPSRHGVPYPDRISVSPDPADPLQLESYADTLRTAQHLVIVVSPNSFHDESAAEHIRLFRAAGGEERIVALVVKGDPASPSAEPGSAADASWMPQWLAYRFVDNAFEPAPPCEPLVIDARLGVSSLAEVRAKLCAALLEVTVPQLGELGVGVRYTAADLAPHPHTSQVIVQMPEPPRTPLPTLSVLASVEGTPVRRHSPWPIVLCSIASVAALAFLAFWPTRNADSGSKAVVSIPLGAPELPEIKIPPATRMHDAAPLVAVVPVRDPALVQISADNAAASKTSPPPAPKLNHEPAAVAVARVAGSPGSVQPELPAVVASRVTGSPAPDTKSVAATDAAPVNPTPTNVPGFEQGVPVVMTPEAEALERKRYELASKRDRLVRLGESRINGGQVEEGIASFEQALETADELVTRTNGGHDEVMELALLYRRVGNVVTNVNSTAEGRSFFARGRRTLQALRASGKLPREAGKILTDLENLARGAKE